MKQSIEQKFLQRLKRAIKQSTEQGYTLKLAKILIWTIVICILSPILSVLFLIVSWGMVVVAIVSAFFKTIGEMYDTF